MAPMDPKTALSILQQHFGLGADAQQGPDGVSQGPSPLTGETLDLNNLRGERMAELEHAATPNLGGNGRPPSPNAPFTSYGATVGDFLGLKNDAANDPYTGDAAHARVAGIQGAHDQADLAASPDIRRAKEQGITDAGNLAEANAEGPLRAQNSDAGRAVKTFGTNENIRELAAKFGLEGGGFVDSAPVHSTPEGQTWIDASAIPHGELAPAMKYAADRGHRLITDKQTVQQLQDVDAGEKNLDYVKQQLASKLPPNAVSRPMDYAGNKLSTIFQSDPELTAFFRTLQPMAMQVYRTVGGMKGAGGMRMGPAIANIANGVMPNMGDTVGTMQAILDDLHRGLANIRSGALSGAVGGHAAPQQGQPANDGAQHFTMDPSGKIVPFTGPSR